MAVFKVALFDLDGTLIDSENQYKIFWDRIVDELNIEYPGLYHAIKGRTLKAILEDYGFTDEQKSEIKRRMFEFEAHMDYSFISGALEFIHDIRSHGVRCAIVTSSNQAKLSAVRSGIAGFDDLFERVLTAEDFHVSKPAPDCYLMGAKVMNASLDECVVFEDAVNGLQSGMASGIYTMGFATGNPRNVIAPFCHHVEDDFRELSYDRVVELLNSRVG